MMLMKTAQHLFLGALLLILLVVMLALTGCKHLANFKRSYTIAAVDRFGQRVEVGVTLEPKEMERMEVLRRLEREGVIARAPMVTEDVEPLQPAAMQLATLTAPAPVPTEHDRQGTGGLRFPASPNATMTWLAKEVGGVWKLRVETDAAVIAMYRAAGWHDMPPPGFEDGEAPQWDKKRGHWRVRDVAVVSAKAPRPAVAATGKATAAKAAAPWESGGDAPWGLARQPTREGTP
jgi:hypothetical protein